MKEIPLTRGYIALVDDEDYERLAVYKWHAAVSGKDHLAVYARRTINDPSMPRGRRDIKMHTVVMPGHGMLDHADHNGLNNQKLNLRPCDQVGNMANQRKQLNRSSIYKGVSWDRREKKWISYIRHHDNRRTIGYFREEADAAQAYNFLADELFGEFAYLNEAVWGTR